MHQPINISSNCSIPLGAALTNPTELSYKKGKISKHYPVNYLGTEYPDAEAAYQAHKTGVLEEDRRTMTLIITNKLLRYPRMIKIIDECGGVAWLKTCSHVVGRKPSRWTGEGKDSQFIAALIDAYETAKECMAF